MIELDDIVKGYRGKPVLRGVTLSVGPGECVGLAGENSCGKTTLLSIAAGRVKPDSGTVQTVGRVALVPQQPDTPPQLTVRETLTLWYAAHRLPIGNLFAPGSPEHRLGLGEYARTRVGSLSGGRQKRLSIAAALLGSPAILLLDEPFNMLDVAGRREMAEMITELKGQGRALLLTSHEPPELSAVCDRVAFMEEGRITALVQLSGLDRRSAAELILQYTLKDFKIGE